MQNTYYEHPSEDALERFLLNQCQEQELDTVETHIMACEPCVARLESLELEMAAMKLALQNMQSELARKPAGRAAGASWRNWLSVPAFSMAGAVAALMLGILIIPQIRTRTATTADVSLSAYRGTENVYVPAGRPLRLHLNSAGLPEGPVSVQLVEERGAQVWHGSSSISKSEASFNVPRLASPGTYYVRLYAPSSTGSAGELLREFAFQVK